MQNVLKETFTGRTDVDLVGIASGGLSAVSLIQQHQPDLVIIDSSLPETESGSLILWLKKETQNVRSLVLVETTQQLKDADLAGADFTLRSYTLTDSLNSILRQI